MVVRAARGECGGSTRSTLQDAQFLLFGDEQILLYDDGETVRAFCLGVT